MIFIHCEKFKKDNLANLYAHFERRNNNYRKYKNENIDKSKTFLNFNLAPIREEGLFKYTKNRISELNTTIKKNSIWVCDWCLSAPQEIVGDYDKCKTFFKEAYNFLSNRYGGENNINIVSAFCHFDEGQKPDKENNADMNFYSAHLHFCFIPIVNKEVIEFDNDKGELITKQINKLCAKDLINKTELSSIHPDLQRFLSEKLDFEINVNNGKTIQKGLTVNQLKYKSLIEKEIKEKEQLLNKMKNDITYLSNMFLELNKKSNYYNNNLKLEEEERKKEINQAAEQIKNILNSYDICFEDLVSKLERRDNRIYNIDLSYKKSLEVFKEFVSINEKSQQLEKEIKIKQQEYKKEIDDDLDMC